MKKLLIPIITCVFIASNAFSDVSIGAQLREGLQIDQTPEFTNVNGSRHLYRVYKKTPDGPILHGLMISAQNEPSSKYRYHLQASLLFDSENKTIAGGIAGYPAIIYGTYPTCSKAIIMVSVSKDKIIISAQATNDSKGERVVSCIEIKDLIGEFTIK